MKLPGAIQPPPSKFSKVIVFTASVVQAIPFRFASNYPDTTSSPKGNSHAEMAAARLTAPNFCQPNATTGFDTNRAVTPKGPSSASRAHEYAGQFVGRVAGRWRTSSLKSDAREGPPQWPNPGRAVRSRTTPAWVALYPSARSTARSQPSSACNT